MNGNQPASNQICRTCPLCGENDASVMLEKGPLRLLQCRRCPMIYANPVDGELASGRFYDRLGVPFYLSPDKLESDYSPVRFEREVRLFRSRCRSGAVLDVGCSTGAFLFQLKDRFPGDYTVTGMDVAGAALDYAESQGIEVIRGSFVDIDFGERSFGAVTFWAVIEHLVHPRTFLHKTVAVLKPGGHCFILVPNMKSLAVKLLGAKYRYIMPDHVNYFTAETLKRFVGLEPKLQMVRVGFSHFNPLVILKDIQGRRDRVEDEERAQLLRKTTAYKRNPLLMPLRWAYAGVEKTLCGLGLADNLVIVVRKKSEE